ncbi:DUF2786 domain-containing protein [Rhodococcus tukisamuensis]|uniref:DUF2786 domain-containing protein n=1 Tax=Rhodococcus tukisamuensis TaxID=168276 RepID=A0A1G7C8M4_9NOCA|nr:DUF2786 domain-containing protein [Rhodococcus tukisamuensis]SDE35724.1 Protein of unknown function [Rhodococcus tukisamuensis]
MTNHRTDIRDPWGSAYPADVEDDWGPDDWNDDDRPARDGHATRREGPPTALDAPAALVAAYERGWQPADVLHVTKRSLEPAFADPAAALILRESHCSDAWSRAPRQWLDQLRAIADAHPGADTDPTADRDPGIDPSHGWPLARFWQTLGPWTALCPPPSAWPRQRTDPAPERDTDPAVADTKVLNKIRGLLAKAESTEFTEEAETLTAKAQELMTRYAIDSALLEAATPGSSITVHSKRIHLDNPYVKQKALLLTAIGEANQVQTVFNLRLAIATTIGSPVDLAQVEMLFTSLLVQATRAMHTAGEKGSRSVSFRKAFLFGFAVRIGQRLTEAGKAATAQAVSESQVRFADLLPILADRADAVHAEVTRLFGPVKTMRNSAVDPRGLRAGRSAADAANLGDGGRAIAG